MSGNKEEQKLDECAAFDILRFVLASTVMLNHIGAITWTNSGNLAVQVFFALSGWLIGGILCRTRARELSLFYFNRATRIWIPYSVAVALIYGLSLVHETRSPRWFEFLAYDLTFTHNWFTLHGDAVQALGQMPLHGTGNHFWSLAVEEQFYLIAPLLITLAPFGKSLVTWTCLASVAYFTGSQYAPISLGVLAAILSARYPGWYLKPVTRASLLGIVGILAILLANDSVYEWSAPLFAVTVVLLQAAPLQRTSITRWLGGVSFPFYLNAWVGTFVFHALTKRLGLTEYAWMLPVEFALGLGAAALMYQLIDVRVMTRRNEIYSPALGWILGVFGYVLVMAGLVTYLSTA